MLTHPNIPPHRLGLKVNAICAVQRDMSVEKGLVRNARVRITALHRRFVEVQIPNTGEVHCLPRITSAFNPARSSWTVNRKQFPLQPAYPTTFNGSQGLTLRRAASHRCICTWSTVHSSFKGAESSRHSDAVVTQQLMRQ
ncbi:hypothetical protein BDR05DRAFT_770200 [Suillus weaverae]|nr:hypothetical protein BDR05DRAFT_770200 [Suillus weaverae]